jgi:hypothetical protein
VAGPGRIQFLGARFLAMDLRGSSGIPLLILDLRILFSYTKSARVGLQNAPQIFGILFEFSAEVLRMHRAFFG